MARKNNKNLEQALKIAQGIDDEYSRSRALRYVVGPLANAGEVEKALEIAQGIDDEYFRSMALIDVVGALAKACDVKRALEIAQGIDDENLRSKALIDVVGLLAKACDVKRTKNILEQVFEIAQGIDDEYCRSLTLAYVAQTLAKAGDVEKTKNILEQVFEIAQGIDDEYFRSGALKNIAGVFVGAGDVERAKNILEQALGIARDIQNKDQRSGMLNDIAGVFAEAGNVERAKNILEKALEIAQGINDKYYRSSALTDVAQTLTRAGDVERALEIAQGIDQEYFRSWALINVAETLTKAGEVERVKNILEQALEITKDIQNKDDRSEMLMYIEGVFAEAGDVERAKNILEQALEIAQGIDDEYFRSWVLKNVAETLAKAGDVKRAKNILEQVFEIAQGINNEFHRSLTLTDVAQTFVNVGDMERAFEIAQDISDDYDRSRVLKNVAETLTKASDVEKALEIAQGIDNEYYRSKALNNVAETLTKAGDVEKALEIAQGIDNEYYRSKALNNVAETISKVDDVDINLTNPDISPVFLPIKEDLKIKTEVDCPETIQEKSSFDIKFFVSNESEFTIAENITIDLSDAKHEFSADSYTINIPRIPPQKEYTVKTSLTPKFLGNVEFILKILVDGDAMTNETISIKIIEKTIASATLTQESVEKHLEKKVKETHIESTNNVAIKRGYTHRGRFIRFKTKIENNSQYPIRDVKVHLSLPSTLHCESPKSPESTIGDIESGETLACEFMLKPLACTTATVKGYIVYKDISGEIQTLSLRSKEIETCRPNLEQLPLTFADVTETISSKQLYKDSEHIRMDGINSADALPLLLKTAQWMNMHHVEDNGHDDQLIFVGRQKVEQTMVIARAALRPDGVKVRCYVEKEDLVAGFLAEFAENLEELAVSSVKPSSDVIWRVMDLFEEIEDTLVYNPSKDQIFTYLNKAHEICRGVDKGISKEIIAFVDNVQLVKEHKDKLDESDITTLKQNIDSWNEVIRGKVN